MIALRPLLGFALVPALAACATVPREAVEPVEVGIIAINDFHGSLEPPRSAQRQPDGNGGEVLVPAGGVAYLASAVDSIRAKYPHTLTVSAGDMIGGSQLASALFLDEPTIGAMNRIGVDFNAVGNHEFDRGRDELERIRKGGCEQHTTREPCKLERFAGARFQFLAANTIEPDGSTMLPGTALRSFGSGRRKVTVGLIGVTLKETADLTSREGLGGATFADEAETVNRLAPQLRAQGADAVILLIHQGGYTSGNLDPSSCSNLTGEIRGILDRMTSEVDVVVSGHTHWSYVCDYAGLDPAKPFLLTSAGVYGAMATDIALRIDPVANRVVAKRARNIIVQNDGMTTTRGRVEPTELFPRFAPRADVAEYVGRYLEAAKSEIERPAGRIAERVFRPGGEAGRIGGTLGLLVADAQLAATKSAGAQIALMNAFGVRSPFNLTPDAQGRVSYGQLYSVQPFTNQLVTGTLTGAELKAVFEEGFDANQPLQYLSPSAGFAYTIDLTRPIGQRVTAMTLDGAPIDPAADYRITVNSFLAGGGDSFATLARMRDTVVARPTDIEALEAWLQADPPRAAPRDDRVTAIGDPTIVSR
ncbi:MAG: bifunctional metallophosphatase/5'-nucleotidase [Novosphingobium sp.]|nr:bifunctional metallophosphatase/5'-nucleotidase [Novosphingobium sp.]